MLFSLLLFLLYIDMAKNTKIEDISICNDTNCNELTDSNIYVQSSKVDDPSLEDLFNETKEDNTFTTVIPEKISSKINDNITEQSKIQSNLTTISPLLSTTMSPETMHLSDKTLVLKKKEICECDLTNFSCDINCCCDLDCDHFHLSAFSYCQDYHIELYNSRYCYNRNFIQRNNTPFIFEKLANNLFCILYDNFPSTYSTDNDLILFNKDLWKMIQIKNYKWKMEYNTILPEYNLSRYYQHGDVLWKLHDKSIGTIEFLQSGFTGICTFKKILKYLQNWKGTCIQNELTNINPYLFTVTYSDFTVIKSPSFNDTFIMKQACHSSICLPVRTHYCLKSFSECNETSVLGFCTNSTCINIVKGLKYVISHNGSAGINTVDAYFNIGNVSNAFYQHFEIEYKWINSNNTKVFRRSGNPGYVMGKPIIIGVSYANKSDIFFNRTDGFLTLPLANKNGECDRINRHIVLFGEDIKLTCSVKLFVKNFTAISCAELQNLTMQFLMNNAFLNISQYYNTYVSKLGNFSSTNVNDWLHIVFDRIPRNIVTAHTIGKRILCSGLVTSMHLNILYSTLTNPKTFTNYKILGVGIAFSKEEDISWLKCSLKNCTDILDVNLISYLNFHDVSKPSKYNFVGGSNLDITLPYDFFYPFLNDSRILEIPNILIFFVSCLLFVLF